MTFSPQLSIPMVGKKPPEGTTASFFPMILPFRVKKTWDRDVHRNGTGRLQPLLPEELHIQGPNRHGIIRDHKGAPWAGKLLSPPLSSPLQAPFPPGPGPCNILPSQALQVLTTTFLPSCSCSISSPSSSSSSPSPSWCRYMTFRTFRTARAVGDRITVSQLSSLSPRRPKNLSSWDHRLHPCPNQPNSPSLSRM